MGNKFEIKIYRVNDFLELVEQLETAYIQKSFKFCHNLLSINSIETSIVNLVEISPEIPPEIKYNSILGSCLEFNRLLEPNNRNVKTFINILTKRIAEIVKTDYEIQMFLFKQSEDFFNLFPLEVDNIKFEEDTLNATDVSKIIEHPLGLPKSVLEFIEKNRDTYKLTSLRANVKSTGAYQAINLVLEKYNFIRSIFNFIFLNSNTFINLTSPNRIMKNGLVMLSEPVFFEISGYLEFANYNGRTYLENNNIDSKLFFAKDLNAHFDSAYSTYDFNEYARIFNEYFIILNTQDNYTVDIVKKMLINYQGSFETNIEAFSYILMWQALENLILESENCSFLPNTLKKLLQPKNVLEEKVIEILLTGIKRIRNRLLHEDIYSDTYQVNYVILNTLVCDCIEALIKLSCELNDEESLIEYFNS